MRRGMWMVGVAILAGACAPPTPESRLIEEAARRWADASVCSARDAGARGRGSAAEHRAEHVAGGRADRMEGDAVQRGFSTSRTGACGSSSRASRVRLRDAPAAAGLRRGWRGGVCHRRQRHGDRAPANRWPGTGALDMLHHPLAVVRAALDEGARVSNLRDANGRQVVDIIAPRGETVTLAIDPGTKLPVSRDLRRVSPEPRGRDHRKDLLRLSGRRRAEAAGAPRHDARPLHARRPPLHDTDTRRECGRHRRAGDRSLGGGAAARAAAERDGEEIGQGIWRLAGGSHHSVLFEFADHLTLFEVPQSEARARAVMARARQLRPGKPLTTPSSRIITSITPAACVPRWPRG